MQGDVRLLCKQQHGQKLSPSELERVVNCHIRFRNTLVHWAVQMRRAGFVLLFAADGKAPAYKLVAGDRTRYARVPAPTLAGLFLFCC